MPDRRVRLTIRIVLLCAGLAAIVAAIALDRSWIAAATGALLGLAGIWLNRR